MTDSASVADFAAEPTEWQQRTARVEDELRRRHGSDPRWQAAADQADIMGRLLADGRVTGELLVARRRRPTHLREKPSMDRFRRLKLLPCRAAKPIRVSTRVRLQRRVAVACGTEAVIRVPSGRRSPLIRGTGPSIRGPWSASGIRTGDCADTVTRCPRTDTSARSPDSTVNAIWSAVRSTRIRVPCRVTRKLIPSHESGSRGSKVTTPL